MKTKLGQLVMFGFIVFSLFTFASTLIDFPPEFTRGFGVNAVYAQDEGDQGEDEDNDDGNGVPIPEPSTLILLGAGLAAGGGIYSIMKYRNRRK